MEELKYYQQEFFKKDFTGPTMKSAYMSAVKWIATNVLSKAEMEDVSISYVKSRNSPTITIHLYAVLNETEVEANHCTICRECHSSFFKNEVVSCSSCSAKAYQRRLDETLKTKKTYYKELIRKQLRYKEEE